MADTMVPYFPGRITFKSVLCLKKIAQKFKEMGLMERALNSQFKYLFKGVPDLLFSGTIVHQMLLRKVKCNSKRMIFNINGEELTFGMKEFALITGLNFDRLPEVNDECTGCPPLLIKYFQRNTSVRTNQIEDCFMTCTDKEDVWKWGLACLVGQYLFSFDPKRFFNVKILHMVEDVEAFLRFPWGKLSFRVTLKGLNADMKRHRLTYMAKPKGSGASNSFAYNVYGFALALQVWTYEVIQSFVPKFAIRKEVHGPLRPRILVYKSSRKNTNPELDSAFHDTEVLTTMEESSMEKSMYSREDFE